MSDIPTKLAPEAYRELAEGESYHPIVPASSAPFEVTLRSLAIGVVLSLIHI